MGNGDVLLSGVSGIGEAKDGEIAVLTNPAYKRLLNDCRASAIVMGEDIGTEDLKDRNLVLVKNPSQAYLRIAQLFDSPRETAKGIHPLATVSDGASIADGASISAYACVETGAVVERDVTIYPFVYIGANARIGEGTTIYPHVTVYDGTVIGKQGHCSRRNGAGGGWIRLHVGWERPRKNPPARHPGNRR